MTFNLLSHDSFASCTWYCPLLNVRNVYVTPTLNTELGTQQAFKKKKLMISTGFDHFLVDAFVLV